MLPLMIEIIAAVILLAVIIGLIVARNQLHAAKAQLQTATAQAQDLRNRIDIQDQELADLRSAHTGLVADKARLDAELAAEKQGAAQNAKTLQDMRDELLRDFKDLSAQGLKAQSEEMARRNKDTLESTLKPLKEHVGLFQTDLKRMFDDGQKDRAALRAELKHLTEQSKKISDDALALTRALKSDQQKQGAWGEMVLETILEKSGLRKGEEYETQLSQKGEDGTRYRPDVVVRLPNDRSMVIDSKVSLTAYVDVVNAGDADQETEARKRHLASLRNHIKGLSSKNYHMLDATSGDYVIMFIPIEGALSEALRDDGALTEYAIDHNITIATPTTLMMALKTVNNVWAVERRNRNAEDIAKRAGLLYDKVSGFVENMKDVGAHLDKSKTAHDKAMGQLATGRGNVLSQVETLKDLGARASKSITAEFDHHPPLPQIADPGPGDGV